MCTDTFDRVIEASPRMNIRFVALNRRSYGGSTPYDSEATSRIGSGLEKDVADYLKNQGVEIAYFVDRFIRENNLPSVGQDSISGGVAILGWSLGCIFSLSAIANTNLLPDSAQANLAKYVRASIIYGECRLDLPTIYKVILTFSALHDRHP
jgi:pimeloyl-ACP methyl ester carboxylesterase